MNRTVGWAIAMDGYEAKQLSPEQREVGVRIVAEGSEGEGRTEGTDRWALTPSPNFDRSLYAA